MTNQNIPKPSDIFTHKSGIDTDTNDATKSRAIDAVLGNPELPIADFRERIVDAVDTSQATIITAETGAGKSTQVPQFLAEAGYEVIVTQPRVVAARTVAERVSEEIVAKKGEDYAGFVGYRTAREHGDSKGNQILFVTDGLQTVRELAGAGVSKKQALVLDEVHEWNENMEVLVAWAKKRMNEDPDFKVCVMSATMEAGPLAEYFSEAKREVPVIEVPGRTFDVKKEEGGDVADQAIKFAREGKNTLVFVPGKAEIESVMAQVQRANIPGAIVLPLHGQLEAAEQRRVFAKYDGAKVIVATNVAQTSITIDDIDAVVDSGLERRTEVKNNVEGLYLRPTSQADCKQRAGRAGRTKEGEYVLAQLAGNQFTSMADRPEYGTPEILRTRLDGMVLRLAKNGFDVDDLEFYHQPSDGEMSAAKKRLGKLGALTEDGAITKIGRQMERMPLESHYARMMIEARKYSKEVRLQLAAALAVQEVDGVTFNGKNSSRRWRQFTSDSTSSDMITQLEVFIGAQSLSYKERLEADVMSKNFSKAQDVFRQLRSVEGLKNEELSKPDKKQSEQLVKCIIAGMVDHLYINKYGTYYNGDSDGRELSNRSMVDEADMIVGNPFDLGIQTRVGPRTLRLIESATVVPSSDVLREVAPQLFSEKFVEYVVDDEGNIVEEREAVFNGTPTGQLMYTTESAATPERHEWLVERAYEEYDGLRTVVAELSALQNRTMTELPRFTRQHALQLLSYEIDPETDSLRDLERQLPNITIEDIISPEVIAEIRANSPDEYRGFDLVYEKGVPRIEMSDDEVLSWEGDTRLPDGREIEWESRYNYDTMPLAKRKAALLAAIEQRKAEQERLAAEAEAQRIEQERLVAEAMEVEERTIAEVNSHIEDLVKRLAEVDTGSVPDELHNQLYDIEQSLKDLSVEPLPSIDKYTRYQALRLAADVVVKDIEKFHHEQPGRVSDQDLTALMERFSKT